MSTAFVSGPWTDLCEAIGVSDVPVHPLGSKAKILLCSVFGPYAQDDEYGSRLINPMELWHNQVTRVQGPFSLRMFHRSWGLMLMQANVTAPCTVLDFPTLDRFVEELETVQYDIIGISSILPNILKVQTMCDLIRRHQPKAQIVIGGHITNLPELKDRVETDHIVRGDGVRWLRSYLGEDADQPIRHPQIWAGIGRHSMGMDLPFNPRTASAALIPSVGCPMGCNFCSTSAMFGGKGKFVEFYQTGDELYAVMEQLEREMKMRSFFVMDENFLLYRPRALRLLELMRENQKPWALYLFSSANAIRSYTMEELVGLGVSWLWMGLEGKGSQYNKLDGVDTRQLIRDLQANGIRVLGSTIIGLEEHTHENIDEAIAYAVSHETDFHQFMLYTPSAGTPLFEELRSKGRLLEDVPAEDVHGQYRFNYKHKHFRPGSEGGLLLRAFNEDFRVNGPSVLRVVKSTLQGWRKYRNHPEKRIRDRYNWEVEGMSSVFAGSLWAAKRWFKDNPEVQAKMGEMLVGLQKDFGLVAKLAAPVIGRIVLHMLKREQKKLDNGWTLEPPTFYEHNYETPAGDASGATTLKWVLGKAQKQAAKA